VIVPARWRNRCKASRPRWMPEQRLCRRRYGSSLVTSTTAPSSCHWVRMVLLFCPSFDDVQTLPLPCQAVVKRRTVTLRVNFPTAPSRLHWVRDGLVISAHH